MYERVVWMTWAIKIKREARSRSVGRVERWDGDDEEGATAVGRASRARASIDRVGAVWVETRGTRARR